MNRLGVGPAEYERLPFYWRSRALAALHGEKWAASEAAAHARASSRGSAPLLGSEAVIR